MIEPILGLFGVVAVGLAVAASFLTWLYFARRKRQSHRETRYVPPTAGQVWMRGDTKLRIKRITRAGRVVVQCGGETFSTTPEAWRQRVISQKLKLEKP